jgi:hypothetical protein
MYVYMYVCNYVCTFVCMFYVCMYVRLYVCNFVYVCMYASNYTCVRKYVHKYVCMFAHIYWLQKFGRWRTALLCVRELKMAGIYQSFGVFAAACLRNLSFDL